MAEKKKEEKLFLIGQVRGLTEKDAQAKFKESADEYLHEFGSNNIFHPMKVSKNEHGKPDFKEVVKSMLNCDFVVILPHFIMDEEAILLKSVAYAAGMNIAYF